MAEVTKGTAHIHNIDATLTNLTISDVNLNKDFANKSKTNNQDGNPFESRKDGRTAMGSITAFATTAYVFAKQGDVITLADLDDSDLNGDYQIDSIGQVYRAGEKLQITLNLEQDEFISLA